MDSEPRYEVYPKEQLQPHQLVRIEPGIHPVKDEDYRKINDLFENGEIDKAHHWNRAVNQRMHSYQPDIVAIDGLSPLFFQKGERGLSDSDKVHVWTSLPGNPADINKKGAVFTIAGDMNFYNFGKLEQVPPGFSYREFQEYHRLLLEADSDLNPNFGRGWENRGTQKWMLLSALSVAIGAGARISNRNELTSRNINRRKFLTTAAEAVGMAALTPVLARYSAAAVSAKMPTERLKKVAAGVVDVSGRFFPDEDIVLNGRTALLITKVLDAKEQIPSLPHNKPAALVVGFGHIFDANQILNNEEVRMRYITEMGKVFVSAIDELSKRFPEIDPIAARERLFSFMSAADVYQVTEPTSKNPGRSGSDKIRNSVSLIGSFKSPRVEKALKGF